MLQGIASVRAMTPRENSGRRRRRPAMPAGWYRLGYSSYGTNVGNVLAPAVPYASRKAREKLSSTGRMM